MHRLIAFVCALLMMMPCLCTAESFDEYVKNRYRARKVVGGAVIIARDGEILYSCAYGYKNAGKTDPVSLDTCFRVASVTKMVTAVGLMQLMEEQQLSLDAPVSEVVGFPVVNPNFPEDPITVRQVLSHTSSLEQTHYYLPDWENLKPGTVYFSHEARPGARYIYSNLNGGLLGAMIEALSGQSVNRYMQENIFEPLGANGAYHAALLKDPTDISNHLSSKGRNLINATRALRSIDRYDDTCDPRKHTDITTGKMYISAMGLHRIMAMLQMGGTLDGMRLLSRSAVSLMMTDQDLLVDSSVACQSHYGLSLDRVYGMPGGTWYGHQGVLDGLSANAYFQPATGLSIVVIANGYNRINTVDGVVTLARELMEKAQELIP